jgi:hypothetical protein
VKRGFTEVFDANAAVYISDTAVDHDTKMALQSGIVSLENIPDKLKDWHPGSDDQVLDLVHPSLYPLMYGTTRILRDAIVPLEDCVQLCGQGKVIPSLEDKEVPNGYSAKHQWLPCEVRLDDAGNAAITSYINNLHPMTHPSLYQTIEVIIAKAVPMWKEALRSVLFQYGCERIDLWGDGYDQDAVQAEMKARQERREEEDYDSDESELGDDYHKAHLDEFIQIPDPGAYRPRERRSTEEGVAKFEQMFAGKNLQVIVKLANIHLTPENPSYEGGSWHIEVRPAMRTDHDSSADRHREGSAE